MKWVDYREKLGIGFDDTIKFDMLRNRIGVFLNSFGNLYNSPSYTRYAIMVGEPLLNSANPPISGLYRSLVNLPFNTKELVSKYIAFYNTFDDSKQNYTMYGEPSVKPDILSFIQRSLSDLSISYEILSDDDGIFIFPRGVEELDKSVVSQPLQWLAAFPPAERTWSKALREYSDSNIQNASDVADKFRKALEAFFQEFFGGTKSLENYKSVYGAYLKNNAIPSEISGNFETLLQAYMNYMNNYAKHRDATSDKVLEYLMYQTGNIMRLLITLNQEAEPHAD